MAQEEIKPIEQLPTAPVATVAPTPSTMPVEAVSPQASPILPKLSSAEVYSPLNVQQVLTGSAGSYKNMKLSKLEKNIAKANSVAEMNQIGIGNQTINTGVISGQQTHQSKIDTARLNAVSGLYNAKLADQQRKEAKKQQDIDNAFREKQFRASQAKSGSANVAGASPELSALAKAYTATGGNWEQTANNLASQGFDVSSGSVIDNELRRRNGLEPITIQTPAQKQAQQEYDTKVAEANEKEITQAQASIPELQKKLDLLNSVTGRGVGAGFTGMVERNYPDIFGAKADNMSRISAIIGKETLDTLLNLKAQGGTLGAVSEKELEILKSSANRIGASEVRDKDGNLAGYRISEDEFKKEIKNMTESTQRVLNEANAKISASKTKDTSVGQIVEKNGKKYQKVANGWLQLN
jgi:hypothetical protein